MHPHYTSVGSCFIAYLSKACQSLFRSQCMCRLLFIMEKNIDRFCHNLIQTAYISKREGARGGCVGRGAGVQNILRVKIRCTMCLYPDNQENKKLNKFKSTICILRKQSRAASLFPQENEVPCLTQCIYNNHAISVAIIKR